MRRPLALLIAVILLTGCNLRFDIQGQTAVVQPNQTCTNAVANRPAMSKPTVFTFALTDEFANASAKASSVP